MQKHLTVIKTYNNLQKNSYLVREGLPKKVGVLLDFVQITSTPPLPPNMDNLYHFFWTPMCQNIWAGVSPSLLLTQYSLWKVEKKLGRALPPTPHLDKIQNNDYFFLRNPP